MKKRNVLILVVVIIVGVLISFGYDFYRNYPFYLRETTDGITEEYLSLFSEDSKNKIEEGCTIYFANTKSRNKISVCNFDHKFQMLIYKLNDSEYGLDSQYVETYSYTMPDFSAHNLINLQNLTISFKVKPDTITSKKIYATYFKDSLKYFCRNDSIIIGQSNCDQFSIKKEMNSKADIKFSSKGAMFFSTLPIIFSYIKRNGSTYLILMTAKDRNDSPSMSLLHESIK